MRRHVVERPLQSLQITNLFLYASGLQYGHLLLYLGDRRDSARYIRFAVLADSGALPGRRYRCRMRCRDQTQRLLAERECDVTSGD
jgi:hypothetical protein